MSRLTKRFEVLKARNEKALVCFITAGDPVDQNTVDIVLDLDKAGADIIEIGIPFSDPLADGPTIQASSQRALEGGMTTRKVLEIVRQVRAASPDLPIVLMTYYNPLLRYGLARYAQDASEAGADAHIVTDLTPEEAGEWKRLSDANALDTIFLVAPTSTAERIARVASLSSGFIYCVSRTGVTGVGGASKDIDNVKGLEESGRRQDLNEKTMPIELIDVINQIKAATTLPICVGFGISTAAHVRRIGAYSDGVVVGSRLVDLIHTQQGHELHTVVDYVKSLKASTKNID